jgi:hypothetical protein
MLIDVDSFLIEEIRTYRKLDALRFLSCKTDCLLGALEKGTAGTSGDVDVTGDDDHGYVSKS